jgi:NADPH-dependent 2,4-dienoyl-CoA reductase/sulfur reductase-like enzyme
VTVSDPGGVTTEISCDAVIFTGGFVPEAELLGLRAGELTDGGSGGPAVDQCWRLADPRLYAAGNVLRSVETAGWAAREGAAAATAIVNDLLGEELRPSRRLPIVCSDPVKLITPSALAVPGPRPGPQQMYLRMARTAVGRLTLAVDGQTIWRSRRFSALPDRRLAVTRDLPDLSDATSLTVGFEESRA